jgi:16S rRNA (uracil1498-N3)-methyltransferase
VSAFDFVRCERSGLKELGSQRLERLGRIARAGLKQSRRSRLPVIRSSASLEEAVGRVPAGGRYVASPGGAPGLTAAGTPETSFALAVGPPGGFFREEDEFLLAEGFSPISLGPSRLTTEAAALMLVSLTRNLLLSI